jgi:hypothetical protein
MGCSSNRCLARNCPSTTSESRSWFVCNWCRRVCATATTAHSQYVAFACFGGVPLSHLLCPCLVGAARVARRAADSPERRRVQCAGHASGAHCGRTRARLREAAERQSRMQLAYSCLVEGAGTSAARHCRGLASCTLFAIARFSQSRYSFMHFVPLVPAAARQKSTLHEN